MVTDLGHGRGWASDDAAASIFRIDKQLGRPVQITEAGRSAAEADANYARYLAYRNGTGPWAPLALPASESVHCQGEAVDSNDDGAPWEANGWIQTARYPDDRDEPWHREYKPDRDQHRNDTTPEEEEIMMEAKLIRHPNGTIYVVDEMGADHLGDFKTADIDLGEFITEAEKIFGPVQQVNEREFDVRVAIADRRWARKHAVMVADVVKAMRAAGSA